MPTKSNERVIKVQREDNNWGGSSTSGGPGNNNNEGGSRWSQQQQSTYTTKRVVQSGESVPVTSQQQHSTTSSSSSSSTRRSSDLFSNSHDNREDNQRRGSTTTTFVSSQPQQIKSSGLVSKALQDLQDDEAQFKARGPRRGSLTSSKIFKETSTTEEEVGDNKRKGSTVTMTIPQSTPSMEIMVPMTNDVVSTKDLATRWSMGTDAQGDVPLTYEIVTRADGKKEFQLLLTATSFSPEDLQVKLTDTTLTISGKHEEKSPDGAFSSKSFYRSCTIPPGVRPDDLNCSLDSAGRLKITALINSDDSGSSTSRVTTTKTVKTTQQKQQQQQQRHQSNWENSSPAGFRVSPGEKEHVITVFNRSSANNNDGQQQVVHWGDTNDDVVEDKNNGTSKKSVHHHTTTTKTVKTFKTVA